MTDDALDEVQQLRRYVETMEAHREEKEKQRDEQEARRAQEDAVRTRWLIGIAVSTTLTLIVAGGGWVWGLGGMSARLDAAEEDIVTISEQIVDMQAIEARLVRIEEQTTNIYRDLSRIERAIGR